MPSAETRRILDDLKKDGLDITGIERQLQTDPFLDKKIDARLGGGILRQEEFTRITNQFQRTEKDLQAQVNKLAALHDNVDSLIGNDILYKNALETITELEDALVAAGANPDEVKKVSYETKSGLTNFLENPANKKIETKVDDKEGDKDMSVDMSKYVDNETYQRSLAQIGTGAILVADKMNDAKTRARELGIQVTSEMSSKLHARMQSDFLTGKVPFEQIADEVLGISVKEKEVSVAAQQKAIDDAVAKGRAEGRAETEKEFGGAPRRQVGRIESPIYARMQRQTDTFVLPEKAGLKTREDGKIEVPVNAAGEPELWKTRGDRSTRVGRASALINNPEALKELALSE